MFDFGVHSEKNVFLFYDLETSGKYPLHQIMSAYFILTDDRFNKIPGYELNLKVQISPLELPEPEAILVNKLSVLKLQTEGISEYQAGLQIQKLIQSVLNDFAENTVYLTGFNSNRFDLPFLRTTLIRNGISPYFSRNLQNADILEFMRFTAFTADDFKFATKANPDGTEFVTFSLESLGKRFGLIDSAQTHDSLDDVNLLLEVTRCVDKMYPGFFSEYLKREIPDKPFQVNKSFAFENGQIVKLTGYVNVHCRRGNSLLYVDLEKFKTEPSVSAIHYLNTGQSGFNIKSTEVPPEISQAAKDAADKFQNITLYNFFETSECDIEQDIYRLPIQLIDSLGNKIRGAHDETILNQDFRRLYRRHVLKNFNAFDRDHHFQKQYEAAFREYVFSRYVSRLKLNKFGDDLYTRTFRELLNEIDRLLPDCNAIDKELLMDLKSFYLNSKVYELIVNTVTVFK